MKKRSLRKNVITVILVVIFIVCAVFTGILTYGQIAKKGVSFELIHDSMKFKSIGKQFASGNIDALYEILSNGYILDDEEAVIIRLAYADNEEYDNEMKKSISEKYHQYFDNQNLEFKGIEEIEYITTPKLEQSSTLYIALKFEGGNDNHRFEYYIGFYKTMNGKYLVTDYFGNPYIDYVADEKDESSTPEKINSDSYHTDDSLFSCLPNELSDFDLYMTRYVMMSKGQKALAGDELPAENGQMMFNIMTNEDLTEGKNSLQTHVNEKLDELAEEGYYVTDVTWNVKEYDKVHRLYRYHINMVLTHNKKYNNILITADCYRISDKFIYIPQTYEVYGYEK